MAGFVKGKGLVSIATGYSGGNYEYTKIDQFIAADNLSITADRAQDVDSYVNANGHLKRNVLKHMRDGISFSTVYMGYDKHEKFMTIIRKAMKLKDCAEPPEKKVRVRYFNEWTNDYETGFFYIPDVEWKYGGTYKGTPTYLPTTFELIEY